MNSWVVAQKEELRSDVLKLTLYGACSCNHSFEFCSNLVAPTSKSTVALAANGVAAIAPIKAFGSCMT